MTPLEASKAMYAAVARGEWDVVESKPARSTGERIVRGAREVLRF